MLKRLQHTQSAPLEGYETYNRHVRVNSTQTLWRRRHDDPMVGAMDPHWGSLHCVCTLIVRLLAQMYK